MNRPPDRPSDEPEQPTAEPESWLIEQLRLMVLEDGRGL
jgi:hypothetical protein